MLFEFWLLEVASSVSWEMFAYPVVATASTP
jgi:hypothetical protein